MFLVLPKGQSLRAVADRLGVAVEELQKHTAVKDVDAPAVIEQRLEVPDGFLRSKKEKRELTDAMSSPSGKRGGMNMWLALDIEQKRTRAAGGLKGNKMRASDSEALDEAKTAYARFEAASNELAADLFNQLTSTTSIDLRAAAFAGLSCAQAQRHLIFGTEPGKNRALALSNAKAAQLADPKLPEAHIAMGLALQIESNELDLTEAREELDRAVTLAPASAAAFAERLRLELRLKDIARADAIVEGASDSITLDALALEALGRWHELKGNEAEALKLATAATEHTATYSDAWLLRARIELAQGLPTSDDAARQACEQATSDEHKARIFDGLRAVGLKVHRKKAEG